MKEEEIEKGDCGPPTRKSLFEIFSDLSQAIPIHLADESQTHYPDTPQDLPHGLMMVLSGVPTPLFRGSTQTKAGDPGVLPGIFFFI